MKLKGNRVLFYGAVLEHSSQDPQDYSYPIKVAGLEQDWIHIPEESMITPMRAGIIAIHYEFGGATFWTLGAMEDLQSGTVEEMIQGLNLTAPRITPEHIDNLIVDVAYHKFEGSQTTVCCITLANKFTVVAHSACVSPENYNQEVGERVSFEKAKAQIGQYEGYLLCQAINNPDDT